MASGSGCERKRQRGKDRGLGVWSSGSGDGRDHPGRPPTEDGVRVRFVVEIKDFAEVSDDKSVRIRGFCKDVNVAVRKSVDQKKKGLEQLEEENSDRINSVKWELKELQNQDNWKVVGMLIHLFAKLYQNSNYESPIIGEVERRIRKDLGAEDLSNNHIGEGLLVEVMGVRPLKPVPGVLGEKDFDKLKIEIADRAISFFLDLKSQIVVELSQAGRQRKDEKQILSDIGDVPPEDSENLEIQHLKKEMASLKAELKSKEECIASLKAAYAAELESKGELIGIIATMLSGNSESGSQDGETQRPENAYSEQKLVEALLEIADLKQEIADLKQKQEAQIGHLIDQHRTPSPTTGPLYW